MRFVTGVSLSFDMKLHRACSIIRLNIIYFRNGDYSRFKNRCLFNIIEGQGLLKNSEHFED